MKEGMITAIACITGFLLAFLPLFLFADAGVSPFYIGEETVVSTFVPEGSGSYAQNSRGGGGQQTAAGNGGSAEGGGSARLVSFGSQQAYEVDAGIPYYIVPEVYGTANGSTDWEAELNDFLYDLAIDLDEDAALAHLDQKTMADMAIATGESPDSVVKVKQQIQAIVKEAKQYKLYGPADGLTYAPYYAIVQANPQEKYGFEIMGINLMWGYLRSGEDFVDSASVGVVMVKNNGHWSIVMIGLA